MGFTSNINQSTLQSTLATSAEQQQELLQDKRIKFQEEEGQRNRDFTAEQRNIAAGDKWKADNPNEVMPDGFEDNLGEELYQVYEDAQDEVLEGSRLTTTGSYKDRMRGQEMMTKGNNRVKELYSEYTELESDLEELVINPDILPSETNTWLKEAANAELDGKLHIVSHRTAGKEKGTGRWVQWENENGITKYEAVDVFKRAMKEQVTRFDTTGWVSGIQKNLIASRTTNADGTFEDKVAGGNVVDGYVDEVMKNKDSMKALRQQFNTENDDDVKTRLTTLLGGAVGLDTSKETTASKKKVTPTKVKESDKETAFSHRKWEVLQATGSNGIDFLNDRLLGKSAKYGEGKDQGVESIAVEGDDLVLTYDDTTNRTIKYNNSNVNDLLNQFTYNLDETKMLWSNVATRDAVNAASEVEDTDLEASDDFTPAGVHKALKLNTNDQGGVDDPSQLKKALRAQFPELLTKDVLVNSGLWDQWWNNKQLDLFGEGFDVKTKEGLAEFTKEVSEKLNILRNKKTSTTKTYKGLDKDGNPIYE